MSQTTQFDWTLEDVTKIIVLEASGTYEDSIVVDWSENLALSEFAMNTVKHSDIDMSPFNLVNLRDPFWSDTLDKPTLDVPTVQEMVDRCFTIFARKCDCLETSKLLTERILVDSQRRTVSPLEEGDLVLLSTKNL